MPRWAAETVKAGVPGSGAGYTGVHLTLKILCQFKCAAEGPDLEFVSYTGIDQPGLPGASRRRGLKFSDPVVAIYGCVVGTPNWP